MQQHADHGILQRLVDALYREQARITRLDAVLMADNFDIGSELLEIVELLPPGTYTRQRLCDQLNSALVAHGWGRLYGTVD